MPGALTSPNPARAASPDRGCTNAANPSGRAIASPVGRTARSPGARVTIDGGHDVRAGVAGQGVTRQRELGVEALDLDLRRVGSSRWTRLPSTA